MANPVGTDDEDRPQLGSRDADEFAPAPLPVGPDGNPTPGVVGLPDPLPPATPEHWICLRGPCRHYMRMVGVAELGNPEGTFEKDAIPRQHYHWCLGIPGQYTDMGEDMIFECNRWDPVDEDAPEHLARERRRSKYLQLHPDHDPKRSASRLDDLLASLPPEAFEEVDENYVNYDETMAAAFAKPPPAGVVSVTTESLASDGTYRTVADGDFVAAFTPTKED